ncbi:GntR family transcriptional regulator [Paraburkholderia susongensis]|uniref:Transcriptional regulator, GntR family n=1 Tax=Paraburkholderia susongensis TaxID=1515439 RepID=A0A1X7LIZ5_9BURK|nr:GntR family transcriptional regulator [Paraburkholderia susongensis]SMG53507.1 transcriptional regulator, GntR family [Paraburkholderia susongensis]
MISTVTSSRLPATTVAEQAADALRRKIIAGELPEGYQLRQDALAAEFGVSRIPVREALVQLEGEGLVRIVPHKGAVVSGLSILEINELFMLRGLLEPVLLKKSAPKLTQADFAELDAILAEYHEELHAQNPSRWGELNTRLHDVLMSKAEQPRTSAIVIGLLQQTDRYTRLQLSLSAESCRRAEEEHSELVRLCKAGDFRGAASLLKRHIDHACSELEQFILSRRRL